MHFLTSIAVFAAAVSASTISVTVGQNGLTFTPNNFAAAPGDLVEFTFFPKNHSVTQSSFADPCHPLSSSAGGIFSGFVPTQAPGPNTNTFTIKVTDSKPIWLYCGQTIGNHCQAGMVAAINAPTTGHNTFDNFVLLAKNASTSTSPEGGIQGGVLGPKGAAANATYTSKTITVTSQYEAPTTALYTDASTTYTTTYLKTYQTTAVVETTYPVQSGAAATQSKSGSSSSASPSASLTPGSGAAGLGASMGVVAAAAFGAAAWALL